MCVVLLFYFFVFTYNYAGFIPSKIRFNQRSGGLNRIHHLCHQDFCNLGLQVKCADPKM